MLPYKITTSYLSGTGRGQVGDRWATPEKGEPSPKFLRDQGLIDDAEEDMFPSKSSCLRYIANLDRVQVADCFDYMKTKIYCIIQQKIYFSN